ncbi:hypothetical protein DPMN_186294 [Dreissena polymorpha]|uniref:Uncharacterized protein n=1 Tax=Dreissena polymorpha TaxID=45954 RepID=A0A9D4DNH5_DREPO|nr:hypothetical protein DPMN_186294 [Dreissena polymorpha]
MVHGEVSVDRGEDKTSGSRCNEKKQGSRLKWEGVQPRSVSWSDRRKNGPPYNWMSFTLCLRRFAYTSQPSDLEAQ